MSTEGSRKAVLAALGANLGIAAGKFGAFALTGSASMLAEGIHSAVDSANQVLLLIGGKHATKAADDRHQFGYGRMRYVYGFIVAVLLFLVGGACSVYEGVHKIISPEPLEYAWVAIGVLLLAIALESASFRTALKEANHVRGSRNIFSFIREVRSPELPVVLLEDAGALTGLVLALGCTTVSVLTDNPVWDGIGAVLIGALLCCIAVLLVREMVAMLVGESALPEDSRRIRDAIEGVEGIEVLELRTMHVGPDEVVVAARVNVDESLSGHELIEALEEAEAQVVEQVPETEGHVFLDVDARTQESQ